MTGDWRVRPMKNRPAKVLTREVRCCTQEKPCSYHSREAVRAGYHLCDRCGAICDCKYPIDGVTCVHGPHPAKGSKLAPSVVVK
jgi:hypothetical protein